MRYSQRMGIPPSVHERISSLEGQRILYSRELMVRGSDRAYYRLVLESGESLILCVYGRDRAENGSFVEAAELFAQLGLSVPAVKAHHPMERWVLQEDLGDLTLLEFLSIEGIERGRPLYRQVVQHVALLHETGLEEANRRGFQPQPPFDLDLLTWENEYFLENLGRQYLNTELLDGSLDEDLARIRQRLLAQPQVLLHRDLQSQNVMVHQSNTVLIDFQGTRRGPALYDVASLLEDPYVELSDSLKEELLQLYCNERGLDPAFGLDEALYVTAACQRLMQALGAYAFLSLSKGRKEFERYIPQALLRLKGSAQKGSFLGLENGVQKAISALNALVR